jgi:type II secretory pathway pseudopilin PulG
VELLLFLAILGIVAVAVLPLLFASVESRLMQQTMASVEQNGAQALQTVAVRTRGAQRILAPLPGETGSVLALQTGSGVTDPTIIGVSGGSLVLIVHSVRQVITSSEVAISHFTVRNTSASAGSPSALVSFTVSRTVRLQSPRIYAQEFRTLVAPFPADRPAGSCGCAMPGCGGSNRYSWQYCDVGTCVEGTTDLDCP